MIANNPPRTVTLAESTIKMDKHKNPEELEKPHESQPSKTTASGRKTPDEFERAHDVKPSETTTSSRKNSNESEKSHEVQPSETTASGHKTPDEFEQPEEGHAYTTESGLKMYDHGKHNHWEKVSIHTAKCDKCDKHNTGAFQRCRRCNFQLCRNCIIICHQDNVHAKIDVDKLDWNPEPSHMGGSRSRGSKATKARLRSSPKTPAPRKSRDQPTSGGMNPSKVAKPTSGREPRVHLHPERITQLARGYEDDYEDFGNHANSPNQYTYAAEDSVYEEDMWYDDEEPHRLSPVREPEFRIRKKPGTSVRDAARAENLAERVRRNLTSPGVLPPPDYAYHSRVQPSMNDRYYQDNGSRENHGSRQEYGRNQEYNSAYGTNNRQVLYEGTPFATYVPQGTIRHTSQYRPYVPEGTYDMNRMHPRYANGVGREQDFARPSSANSVEGYATHPQYGYSPSPGRQQSSRTQHRVSFASDNDNTPYHPESDLDGLPTSVLPAVESSPRQTEINELKKKYGWSKELCALLDEGNLDDAKICIEAAMSLMDQHAE
jgi:hypothetical protein